jgi:hypothetical protein
VSPRAAAPPFGGQGAELTRVRWALMVQNPQKSGFCLRSVVFLGGRTTGPRFIVPAPILLAPLVGIGFDRMPRLGIVLLAISISNYVAFTTVSRSVQGLQSHIVVEIR